MSEQIKKRPITIPEAKAILEKINLDQADQIQKRTLDYLSKFSKTTPENARRLVEELMKKGLTEEEAIELVNSMPKSAEEIRVFSAGWKKFLPTETVQEILNILKQT
ncbi:MAG: RNA polymerase Rpb4 [Thaumarchaeota archaeon]|nr:RNA polymerase Rpb4 [Nitrososphaerota archaeon]